MTLIIENAKFINKGYYTIIVENGKITAITNEKHSWHGEVISLPDDTYVSAGWIDLHTHAFPKYKPYCAHPDDIGYVSGVTTVVDAGSSGADNLAEFCEVARHCKTNVLSFLNVSRTGLRIQNELANIANISLSAIERSVRQYHDFIVGLKVRMSKSVVADNGMKPLIAAKKIAQKVNLPVMVHIGNAPPMLSHILNFLDKGDIVTHCFNEKPNNHIYSQGTDNLSALKAAINRGVLLDIGHGSSSFSFDIARRAKKDDIHFHTISTDIYEHNQQNGPVHNMATTLTKFLALGYTLKDVIRSVTIHPANAIGKQHLGKITVGLDANLTFFSMKKTNVLLTDSLGNELISPYQIIPHSVLIGGNYYECE